MCNCSKKITKTECQRLKKYVNDPDNRNFIYHVFDDDRGLSLAQVPKGEDPNEIATKNGFIGSDGFAEWYYIKEHPCLHEKETTK
ncbi:hypothetical protein [Chryseobacterium sp. M5A1_1a]